MKIIFDPQIFQLGYSGMRRYYSVLYQGLTDAGIEIIYPEDSPFSKAPVEVSFLERALHPKANRILQKFTFYQKRQSFFRALENLDYDLLYLTSPAFETDFLHHLKDKPFVMTVHDTMEIARGAHTFIDEPRDTMSLGYLANRAERVACVSNYTKNDLCNRFLVDSKKTETVYLANFLDAEPEKMSALPDPYIFYVGTRNGRKNFFEWIKAVAPYLKTRPELSIVVTGQLTDHETFFYEKLGVFNQIRCFEDVTDEQLVTLYRKATAMVYPSLYEGFGLPVIEAMANGCPVIASDCTSIPEVAGSAASYIDPTDSESMLQTFQELMEDPQLQKKLSTEGIEQSRKFSKEKFISGMIELFEEAIESHQK